MSFHLGQRSRDSVYLCFNVTQSDNNTCRCEATIIRCCFFHPFIHIRGFVIQLFTITIFETLFEARNDRGYHLGSQLLESFRDSFKTLLRGLFSIRYDRCLVSRWRTSISFSDSVEMFREWKNIGMSAAVHAIKFAVKVLSIDTGRSFDPLVFTTFLVSVFLVCAPTIVW